MIKKPEGRGAWHLCSFQESTYVDPPHHWVCHQRGADVRSDDNEQRNQQSYVQVNSKSHSIPFYYQYLPNVTICKSTCEHFKCVYVNLLISPMEFSLLNYQTPIIQAC